MKQSSIFHVTLLRILEPQALKREQIEAIHEACKQETDRLKGAQFTASSLWYVAPFPVIPYPGYSPEFVS